MSQGHARVFSLSSRKINSFFKKIIFFRIKDFIANTRHRTFLKR
ncbi:hypothetical protein LEP1GSC193_2240 [Leptospira alstonii serovar Pingchang str. 80-412]|uniref:Uncharacterized protein n=1 Tax=Leptospira alstonii serovar Pingchang str. 80-412 TaxID=1218564 RepID=T0H7M5_9LEPT|nr:hypothetical protein LEP1GSC193_2240 [Leptospira alstonii serovar Pingchang str. 80-412]